MKLDEYFRLSIEEVIKKIKRNTKVTIPKREYFYLKIREQIFTTVQVLGSNNEFDLSSLTKNIIDEEIKDTYREVVENKPVSELIKDMRKSYLDPD